MTRNLRLILLMSFLPMGEAWATPAKPDLKLGECMSHSLTSLVRDGMLALDTGELLVWGATGQIQIRQTNGVWGPVLQTALKHVGEVIADQAGLLLVGGESTASSEVLFLGRDGKRKDGWIINDPSVRLFSGPGGRWAVSDKVLYPLLPQGKVGPAEPLPPWFTSLRGIVSALEVVAKDKAGAIMCVPESPAMDGYGAGICERTGPNAWHVTHDFWDGPLLCGKWIVQANEHQVGVRSAETGRVAAEKKFSAQPRVACAGADRVVVGEKTLKVLVLPSLNEIVRRKLPAKGPVSGVTFLGDEIAFSLRDSPGIFFLSLPCALPAGR